MNPGDFTSARSGRVVRTPDGYHAFLPHPLPPAWSYNERLLGELAAAERAVGYLAGIATLIPEPYLLIRPFVAREAVLSSRIEGTQASLSDLFLFEAAPTDPPPAPDVREVFSYVQAMEQGLDPNRKLPLSLRLLRSLHTTLMGGVRAGRSTPGEFRRSQNWIGPPGCTLSDATYVPPPVPEMKDCLDAFERYLHAPSPAPPLARLACIHYQFEAIHPFLDGNGRVGRLLVSLLLGEWKLLAAPLLTLSAFFERNRSRYYDLLLAVSQRGAWEEWTGFFLTGVRTQALDAVARARRLERLRAAYRARVGTPRASVSLVRLVDELFARPILTVPRAQQLLGLSYQGAALNIRHLVRAGILVPLRGRTRPRRYLARELLALLEEDTAPSGNR